MNPFLRHQCQDVVSKWFSGNQTQVNACKCHILINTDQKVQANICKTQTINRKSEKLLKVNIGNKVKFDEHIKKNCGKAKGVKENGTFYEYGEKEVVLNVFFNSQFN